MKTFLISFVSFMLMNVLTAMSPQDLYKACKRFITDGKRYHCYDERTAKLCDKRCAEILIDEGHVENDCPWGNTQSLQGVCKLINSSTCEKYCSNAITERTNAIGVNCCSTCVTSCNAAPRRSRSWRRLYPYVYHN